MSHPEERPITARVEERPAARPRKLADVRPKELMVRFVAGALTSVLAGVVALVATPRVGGIFLAFPAILAASMTLVEEQEDSAEAREDARGAVMGGGAMALFAAVAALGFGHLAGAVALALAAAAWLGGALLGYLVAWFK